MPDTIIFDLNEPDDDEQSPISGQSIETREALKNQARLQHLMDYTPTIIYSSVSSGDFKLTFVSDNVTRVLGYTAEEVLADDDFWFNHIHEDDRPTIFNNLPQLFVNGEHIHEYRFLNSRGQHRWIEDRLRLIRDENGEPLEIIGSMNDVTEQKAVASQLEFARDQALELAKAKSEFLANMSHEIRTPMNGVLGMLNLLQTTELDLEQSDYVNTAYNSGDVLLTVLNDILDFSKLESGKLEIEQIEFNLRQLIEDVADLFASMAQEKGLELVSIIPYDISDHVLGDPARLRQILSNLVSNAIKFTASGEVVLRVSNTTSGQGESARTSGLLFEVADTGIGISKEAQGRIFESFEQSDGSTTRLYGGTGLGLSISKRLVELMDGDIGVQSVPGQGANFWFRLPILPPADPVSWQPSRELRGLKALIIESNVTSREYTRHLIESMGIATHVKSTAREARALLSQQIVDIIILERSLPDCDGIDLVKELSSGLTPTPKMVLLTLMGMKGDARRAHSSGALAYLTKPIRREQLHAGLAEAMSIPLGAQVPLITRFSLSEHQSPGMRILVVEDNRVNQKVALGMLSKLGYHADVAENGLEALAAIKQTKYDLLLIDCQMPEMDGYEATREIRRLEQDLRIPILAMTAHIMQENLDACLEAGMDDYLLKPIRLAAMVEKLEQWLPRSAT